MKTVARGPDFAADPGDLKTVSDAFGQALVDAGSAEKVDEDDAAAHPAARRERATAGRRAKR
jgi:hypothetical protein